MSESSEKQEPKPSSVLSLFEHVHKFKYALLTASLVLAIDVGRTLLQKLGFTYFDWFAPQSGVPLGTALVFVAGYLFFMAGLSPFIRVTFEYLLREFRVWTLLNRIFDNQHEEGFYARQYAHGYVLVREAEEDALLIKDDFWIKRINEYRVESKSYENEANFLASASFSCILLFLLDYWMFDSSAWAHLAVQDLLSADSIFSWGLTIASFILVAAPWWVGFLYPPNLTERRRWIKHPELAAKKQKEMEAKRNPVYGSFQSAL